MWPADRTRWDPSSRSITVETIDGIRITFSDGDRVAVGGGGSSLAEGGQNSAEWASSINWVRRPSDSCLRDIRWFVTEVDIPQ